MLPGLINVKGWITLTCWCVCVCYIGDIPPSSLIEISKMFTSAPGPTQHSPPPQPPTIRDYAHPLNNILMLNLLEGKSQHVAAYRTRTRWRNTSNNPVEIKRTDWV